LHCIACKQNQLFTGSEDGTVRLWDTRSIQYIKTLDPFNGAVNTMQNKWISCMAIDSTEDWLVAGGGNHFLCLWYIPSLTATSWMPVASTPQVVTFDSVTSTILSAGNEPHVYHWKSDGKLERQTKVPSIPSIFSLSISPNIQSRVLAITGATPQVGISLPDFSTQSFTIAFK